MIRAIVDRRILLALGSAVLFGASTPLAKAFVGLVAPVLLAGLLYAGSGLGLAVVLLFRRLRRPGRETPFRRPHGRDLASLLGAMLFGGILAPVALMLGLVSAAASTAALLQNLEAVFTAMIAWFVFRENVDRRVAAGMTLIVAGGLVLAWHGGERFVVSPGMALIAAACLAWAIDNNLTRNVATFDAMAIACAKGLIAGPVNVVAALALGAAMPHWPVVAGAAVVGFFGYGLSLTLFVAALRELGTARTSAYFSIAPFVGAALAVAIGHEPLTAALIAAALLMACGVGLHIAEVHAHPHEHLPIEHVHLHVHDEHHRHAHDPADATGEPHVHRHVHAPLRHAHAHFPDIHHRHEH